MAKHGTTDEGFYRLIKRQLGRKNVRAIARNIPEAHLLGEYRYAITRSPCCGRRVRVRIVQRAGKWCTEDVEKCPKCRRIYRIEVPLTRHGFARSVRFFAIAREH